jgi:ADP-ribosylglycohydrolase
MVAQSLLGAGSCDDEAAFSARFRRQLAWRLRFWLLGLPAGIGLATLRSLIKLWLNPFSDGRGVPSAGNGPAMRSAIIGVCLGDRPERMRAIVAASTRLTHADPRAEQGALAVALAAHFAARRDTPPARSSFPDAFEALVGEAGGELSALVRRAAESAARDEPAEAFAASIGCRDGVSGFVLHTVPVALQAWFRHEDDHAGAVESVVRCGGDTDTVAAIVGGIVGARVGPEGVPADWLDRLAEWPRSTGWIRRLGERLGRRFAAGEAGAPLPLNVPALFLRNLVFMAVVLLHGFRRLLPPY